MVAEMDENVSYNEQSQELYYCGKTDGTLPRWLVDEYGGRVRSLHVPNCKLRWLTCLADLDCVESVSADGNCISQLTLPPLPRLHTLSLNNNKLVNLDITLRQIRMNAPMLRYFSIIGNPCSRDQVTSGDYTEHDYSLHRLYVLSQLPNLLFLDHCAVTSVERRKALTRGLWCRLQRPIESVDTVSGLRSLEAIRHSSGESKVSPPHALSLFHPISGRSILQSPTRAPSESFHEASPMFERFSVRYTGRYSEGNRFISSSDL